MNKVLLAITLTLTIASPALAGPRMAVRVQSERSQAPHYYALGDSMTYGYGTTNPAVYSFPAQLATANGFQLTDLGIPGIDANGILTDEVPSVKSDAALVTMWIGVNNVYAIANGQESLFTVVGQIATAVNDVRRQAPHAEVMLMTPIDMARIPQWSNSSPESQGVSPQLVHEVTVALSRNIAAWRLPVCDVSDDSSYYANQADFFTDGFHPSNLGAWHIAADVNACIHHQKGLLIY